MNHHPDDSNRKNRTIGIIDPHYNLERVSYGLSAPGFSYRRLRRVPIHRLQRRGTFFNYTPLLVNGSRDVVHTFNMIPINAKRFVVSFEMELPRYLGAVHPWQNRLGQRLLSKTACKSILPLSEIACRHAKEKYRRLQMFEVAEKIRLFRGSLRPSSHAEVRRPNTDGPLRLLFVGRDALRKGILPTLDAIEEVRRGGVEVELTLVSSMQVSSDYVYRELAPSLDSLRDRIESTSWIRHISSSPNQEVRQLMYEHDALLLPTLDESLGWVIIEAALEGCPAVSTNIYAIPELVEDGVTGFLLDVPKNEDGRWTGLRMRGEMKSSALQLVQNDLKLKLAERIGDLASNRDRLHDVGVAARKKLLEMYDRQRAVRQLREAYEHALC